MNDQTPDSLIPYDEIVQEALRAVVGRVLGEVEATGGLPGEHHFYITFKTGAAGVDIPRHLSERFPDEMTIVIQNRFWDLKVRDGRLRGRPELQPGAGQALHPLLGDHRLLRPGGQFPAPVPGAGRRRGRRSTSTSEAENDRPLAEPVEDGSNVVSVDFSRKK